MKTKGISIQQFKHQNEYYSIRTTEHAMKRMIERGVSEDTIKKAIHAIKPQLKQIKQEQTLIFIKQIETAIIIAFKLNKINIITAFKNSKPFAKEGTNKIII